MTNYIKNKKVKSNKVNNMLDLKGIGKVAQRFISTLYNSGCDSLITDNNHSFRQKIFAQFTLKIYEVKSNNKNEKKADKSAFFIKLPLPISAKTFKEVKKISKFFKKNTPSIKKKDERKLYIQVLSSLTITREIFKIKEIFPKLQVKKQKTFRKSLMVKVSPSQK